MTLTQQIKCFRFSVAVEVDLFEKDGPRVTIVVSVGNRTIHHHPTLAELENAYTLMDEPARALFQEFMGAVHLQMEEWGLDPCATA